MLRACRFLSKLDPYVISMSRDVNYLQIQKPLVLVLEVALKKLIQHLTCKAALEPACAELAC